MRAGASAAISVERFFEASLLGMAATGYLALAGSGYLDWATLAVMTAGLLWRALILAGFARPEVPARLATPVTVIACGAAVLDYAWISHALLTATLHLAFFLVAIQILTAHSVREHLATAAIAFLELLAAAVAAVNVGFFVFLALYLLFAMGALMSAEIRRSMTRAGTVGGRSAGNAPRLASRLAALAVFASGGILALTGGLFLLLPRTADAAFSHLLSRRLHLPGFATEIRLGEIGEIKISSRPVMHIHLWGKVPGGLKWRGGTLEEFDGKRWSNPAGERTTLWLTGGEADLMPGVETHFRHGINYDITYDEISTDALFFAGEPRSIRVRAARLERVEGGYRLTHPPVQGFHYAAYSLFEDPPESVPPRFPLPVLSLAERERALQLPRLDPRIPKLAARMTAGLATDIQQARAIERHLGHDYAYTIRLPDHEPADPLAYFLFTRRMGHCEYFASAMTVMLRTLGIPARLATGFQSGVFNPFTDEWLVRASDAHTWVEAWISGYGWTTFDPTPSASGAESGFAARLDLYLDAAQTFWRQWVVGYDAGVQGSLADRFEQTVRRLGLDWLSTLAGSGWNWDARVTKWLRRFGLPILLVLAGVVVLRILSARLLRLLRFRRRVERARRGEASMADATLLYQRMLSVLEKRGYEKPAWFTPAEFAASLERSPFAGTVAEFTAAYNALRFGGHTEVAPRLSTLLDYLDSGQ
ncbi:MAG TPA: transglutaminaseTgpA domain-containing protein [Bryobacteraceae bacterium]|nr:transglutaminaseTgpA domain-containing protein [Bryobacteraceae bacterium]